MSQLCIEQNERSTCRKVPVMVLCNHSSTCRDVMKSCKLLQPIAVGCLCLFRTGSEEHNRLRLCSLPTHRFLKICRFWYSSLSPFNYASSSSSWIDLSAHLLQIVATKLRFFIHSLTLLRKRQERSWRSNSSAIRTTTAAFH